MITDKVYIFDLDGTIALNDHRQHFLEGDNKDWDAFFEACHNDEINEAIRSLMWAVNQYGYKIYIVTGRSKAVQAKTISWLRRYSVPYDKLVMRPEDNYQSDDDLKPFMLHSILDRSDEVQAIFDDRNSVVEMWRDNGYQCFHVADGDF